MSRTEWEAVLTTPARAHAWNSSSGGGRSGRNVRDLRDRLGPPRLARYGCAHPWARLDTARPRPQNDGNQGRRQAFCSCQGCGPSARRFARPTEERMVTVIDQTDRVSADHHAPGHLRRVDVAAEEVRARVERGDAVRARCGAWEDLPDEQPRRRGAVGVDGHIVRGVHIAVRELNREGLPRRRLQRVTVEGDPCAAIIKVSAGFCSVPSWSALVPPVTIPNPPATNATPATRPKSETRSASRTRGREAMNAATASTAVLTRRATTGAAA
jgi:hypothetical protein